MYGLENFSQQVAENEQICVVPTMFPNSYVSLCSEWLPLGVDWDHAPQLQNCQLTPHFEFVSATLAAVKQKYGRE